MTKPKLSIETCTKALNRAAMNRKTAIQIELAVGLAIYLVEGETSKEAKQLLTEAYGSAGNDCLTTDGVDYKTVNRRVNTTADLFNKLSIATIRKWAGNHNENNLIDTIILGLEPYELYTTMDVVRLCAPTEATRTVPKEPLVVTPDETILKGPEQEKVVEIFRRAADKVAKGAFHIEIGHLALMVPASTSRDELVEMAGRLLALAEEKKHKQQHAA